MKAVQILGDKSCPKIATNHSVKTPEPENDDILVQVYAAGITGDEVLWPEVYNTPTRIPGHDISGVISAFGPDYNGPLRIGQDVFAFLDADRGQGQAQYVICSPDEVAPKPASISHAEAAALPIPVLTAWEAMAEHGKLEPDMKVLVTGASGAVGIMLVQFVKQVVGAHIIALASTQHHSALMKLGASEVADYNTKNWERLISDVDVVFDTVGGDILAKTWETVKENGVIVTVGDPPPPWAFGRGTAVESIGNPGVRYLHFIVSANAERLRKASEMIDSGRIKALAVKAFPFQEAEQAWLHAQQRNRGHKVVIEFEHVSHDVLAGKKYKE
ncbi:uncharacterized protein NECHADRAFT_97186 [Fusarium vanettenii 77-13-4]|uniref:Enoyl reductase (ER) domain-containing protein n=1 Tax=Fusarium vanettenii (strain ATCC MYA-4622 / CBS 123669 / FGSC 9596 / NRRL 45880 / 77-13-4) TaxID=660122 RepID=C7ZGW6_FUSV7|nr:uncharacterized protein NECHADRAFT_97186 [Fusarium vanettenii 77-13-4]EEU36592.1 hypothetical protein NECHADRAFT_97186 [Fusarium vanettenii 77-13-4]